jgi:hypothetical protein
MSRIFGNVSRLIKSNAVVDIEVLTVAQSGGFTVQTFPTALSSNVAVLMTQTTGQRGTSFTDAQTDRVTISGVDTNLQRRDTRIKVITAPVGLEYLEGVYFRVDAGVPHAEGLGGLLGKRITVQCSRFDFPQQV